MEEEMKKCKFCMSEIPVKAKICPHCRKNQTKFSCLRVILGLLVAILLLMLLFNFLNNSDIFSGSNNKYVQEQDIQENNSVPLNETWLESDIAIYKSSCESSYTYEEISRNPENYIGKKAKFEGQVIQVLEEESYYELRVDITKTEEYDYISWSDTIYVSYKKRYQSEPRILEDDIVILYGEMENLYSYKSIFDQSITLPKMNAKFIEIEK